MYWIGYLLGQLVPIISFADAYKAVPSNITIGYSENVTIQVGVVNMTSGQFEPPFFLNALTAHYLSFSAEFPQGNPGGAWFVNFDPPLVYQNTPTDILVTNATISLTSPPSATNPIQSSIIRIKIINMWVAGNFWFAGDQPGFESLSSKIFWFLGAITAGYGKFSGKILPEEIYVDVLVNVKPFHSVKIQALPLEKLAPNQIMTIPVLIENQGNYNDTFNFRIKRDSGSFLTLTNNATVTLRPGEQGQAMIGVAIPANVFDTGTLHTLTVEAFSTEQPNITIAQQILPVETQGFYFSEMNSIFMILLGLILLIIIVLIVRLKRKISEKTGKKPEKPWTIPEEKQHLQELRRTDKKAYEQERIMMKDEYKSALLWYEGYRKSLRKKLKENKLIKYLSTIFKKSEKTLKTEQKKKQPSILTKDITKEKALAKIKREQEKQLRKMNI